MESGRGIRGRLTYANVTASVALFIALGGVSIAATGVLAPRSVGTRQLRNGSVTPAKLGYAFISGTASPRSGTESITAVPPCPAGAVKCPPPRSHSILLASIRLRSPAPVLIIARDLVSVTDHSNQDARVDLAVSIDRGGAGGDVCSTSLVARAHAPTQVSCVGMTNTMSTGRHRINVTEDAFGERTASVTAQATAIRADWSTLPPR